MISDPLRNLFVAGNQPEVWSYAPNIITSVALYSCSNCLILIRRTTVFARSSVVNLTIES